MKVFFQIAYGVTGLVQLLAVWDGMEYAMGAESFFGKIIAFFVTLFVTYIPLVGSSVGVYGATHVWDWSLTKSLILFFWYIPVYLLFIGFAAVANRK